MSERVFRGGVLQGGAPFTKDAAYQRGYCRTFNFLRAAVEQRDLDLVRAFLAGKMSVDDAALVRDLIEEGLCVGPAFLPEWFIDIDRLNAICTHSVTMNRFSLPSVTRYYARRRAVRGGGRALRRRGGARAGRPGRRGSGLRVVIRPAASRAGRRSRDAAVGRPAIAAAIEGARSRLPSSTEPVDAPCRTDVR